MRYGGQVKFGSSLESHIWYDPYQARELRLLRKVDLFISFLINLYRVFRVF